MTGCLARWRNVDTGPENCTVSARGHHAEYAKSSLLHLGQNSYLGYPGRSLRIRTVLVKLTVIRIREFT